MVDRVPVELVEIQKMLHDVVQLAGRATVRVLELRGQGWSGSTPGNGSPGGGKGASSRTIRVPAGDGVIDRVPVSSVEAAVLDGGVDEAARGFVQLCELSVRAGQRGSLVVLDAFGQFPIEPSLDPVVPLRWSVHSFRCARLLVEAEWSGRPAGGWRRWVDDVTSLWNVTQRWAPDPTRPKTAVDRSALAVDLTEMWCRSCLRVGERSPRHRGELCRWCYQFQAGEGFLVPVDIVEAHAAGRKVTEQMIAPHRQAHRDRIARKGQRRR